MNVLCSLRRCRRRRSLSSLCLYVNEFSFVVLFFSFSAFLSPFSAVTPSLRITFPIFTHFPYSPHFVAVGVCVTYFVHFLLHFVFIFFSFNSCYRVPFYHFDVRMCMCHAMADFLCRNTVHFALPLLLLSFLFGRSSFFFTRIHPHEHISTINNK